MLQIQIHFVSFRSRLSSLSLSTPKLWLYMANSIQFFYIWPREIWMSLIRHDLIAFYKICVGFSLKIITLIGEHCCTDYNAKTVSFFILAPSLNFGCDLTLSITSMSTPPLTHWLPSRHRGLWRPLAFLPLLTSSLLTKIGIIYVQLLQQQKIFPVMPRSEWSADWSLRYAQKCSKSEAKDSDQNLLPLHRAAP